jgi:hypothetical protein
MFIAIYVDGGGTRRKVDVPTHNTHSAVRWMRANHPDVMMFRLAKARMTRRKHPSGIVTRTEMSRRLRPMVAMDESGHGAFPALTREMLEAYQRRTGRR